MFFGVHTLFSKFDELNYKQTTRGFGVSSGAEQFFSSRSIILQLDVSFVKNNINNLDKSFYLSSRNSSWRPIVSASVALTFSPKSFKKKTILKRTDSAKSQLFKNKAVLKKKLVKEFDPETGDPIEKKSTDVIFDPETGELMIEQFIEKFLMNGNIEALGLLSPMLLLLLFVENIQYLKVIKRVNLVTL